MDKPLKVTIIENGKVIYDELTDEEKTIRSTQGDGVQN